MRVYLVLTIHRIASLVGAQGVDSVPSVATEVPLAKVTKLQCHLVWARFPMARVKHQNIMWFDILVSSASFGVNTAQDYSSLSSYPIVMSDSPFRYIL